MRAHEKLLERMKQSQSGWGEDDFRRLYEGFGFTAREGKHIVFSHPAVPGLRRVVARHTKLANLYAVQAIEAIEMVQRLNQEENPHV